LVIDEEHHPTYKEDRAPRYDARRVAIERSEMQGAVCVLVSPSPRVETGHAVLEGTFGSVTAPRERHRTARPVIEVGAKDPDRAISALLHRRIRETLNAGGRVGLLAPARGYARAVWCAQCRRSLRCPRCEGGFHFDRSAPTEQRLRCNRCGTTGPAPDSCPHCGSTDFRWLGAGSERLAEQLEKAFPRSHVEHVDPTTIETASARAQGADIYVTTWIGTKSSVRPDVSLVGIVDADALIRRPHFRSAEQAYQACAYMAEWAGAAEDGGRLVVQSDEPNHYVLQALARADYRYFLERELEQRAELRYPPFCELVRIRVSGRDMDDVTRRLADVCRPLSVRILGPIRITAPDPALELLVKTDSAQEVAGVLRGILPEIPSTTRVMVDVDPR
jgi:primosomal protein N' (replication factor Y)